MAFRLGLGLGLLPVSVTTGPTSVPVNVIAPSISGIQTHGQTLTCAPGSWSGLPSGLYAYQWKRDGSNIGGATAATRVLALADVGHAITCGVIATNIIGPSAEAVSNAITPVAALTISGTPPGGIVGTPYSATPVSTGGHATKSFALTGTLPAGLGFSNTTGAITGTPTGSGTASGLNITVTDGDGLTASLGTFSIVISVGASGGSLDLGTPEGVVLGEMFGIL